MGMVMFFLLFVLFCARIEGNAPPIGNIPTPTPPNHDCSIKTKIITDDDFSKEVEDLVKNVSDYNVVYVANELERLTEMEEEENLSANEIDEVSYALQEITQVESSDSNVTNPVIGTVNILLSSNSSAFGLSPETTSRILNSIEKQINTSSTIGQNYTKNEESISVRILSFDSNNLKSDVVFFVGENQTDTDIMFEDVSPLNSQYITLPKQLLSANEKTNVSFTSYNNPNLFQSNMSHYKISDVVLSATIYDTSMPEEFDEPVTIVFRISTNTSLGKSSCVFWDDSINEFGEWSEGGCEVREISEDGHVTCTCKHLTNFAVLFFPHKIDSPGLNIFLEIVTYFGCGMSIICLTLTILTITTNKNRRKTEPQIIMLNLCTSLLCLYVMFILGVVLDTGSTVCKCVAALIHYFLLTSIAWTSVEAVNMYYLFIIVTSSKSFLNTGAALAWGLPLIPITILLLIDVLNEPQKPFYGNTEYCYITNEVTGYLLEYMCALVLPILIVIISNAIIFTKIIHKLYFVRNLAIKRNVTTTAKEKKKRVTNAVAISILLGLTWAFGFLSFDYPGNTLFVALFCIFNSFQGVAIFYLFCVRHEEYKNTWHIFLKKCKCQKETNRIHPRDKQYINESNSNDTTETTI